MPGSLAALGRQPRAWPTLSEPSPPPAPAVVPKPTPAPPVRPDPVPVPLDKDLHPVAAAALAYLETPPPGAFRDDCSGFVCAALDRAGTSVSGNTASMWADAQREGRVHHRKRPDPGDLAFFDDTHDRNGNGRMDDPLTHIGVVVSVDQDGTILVAHAGTSKGRSTLRMNLRHPSVGTDEDGHVLNDPLRIRADRDPARMVVLAGQLWRGFASPPVSFR